MIRLKFIPWTYSGRRLRNAALRSRWPGSLALWRSTESGRVYLCKQNIDSLKSNENYRRFYTTHRGKYLQTHAKYEMPFHFRRPTTMINAWKWHEIWCTSSGVSWAIPIWSIFDSSGRGGDRGRGSIFGLPTPFYSRFESQNISTVLWKSGNLEFLRNIFASGITLFLQGIAWNESEKTKRITPDKFSELHYPRLFTSEKWIPIVIHTRLFSVCWVLVFLVMRIGVFCLFGRFLFIY